MNINDDSTTSAISHVPAFRMNLTEFQGFFGVMRRMRNISLLCSASHDSHVMEIYGSRFAKTAGRLLFSSRLLAIMPSNLNAVFPCLMKEVRSTEKRSIVDNIFT